MEITSITNNKVKTWMKYQQKKYRDKDTCFLVEGEHLIQEAIMAQCLKSLIVRMGVAHRFANVEEIYYVSDEIMDKLSKNVSHVDFIGVCHKFEAEPNTMHKVLLLDDVQDPGNLGTMIRTAYSFGFDAIFVSKGCVDVYNEKVVRSTQGALFHIPLIQVELLSMISTLQAEGFVVYATSLRDAKALSQFDDGSKVALIFGNEGSGVKEEVVAASDASIIIEMASFESLNVAVAAGICMYHFRKK